MTPDVNMDEVHQEINRTVQLLRKMVAEAEIASERTGGAATSQFPGNERERALIVREFRCLSPSKWQPFTRTQIPRGANSSRRSGAKSTLT